MVESDADDYSQFEDMFEESPESPGLSELEDIFSELYAEPPYPVAEPFRAKHADRVKEEGGQADASFDAIFEQIVANIQYPIDWSTRSRFLAMAKDKAALRSGELRANDVLVASVAKLSMQRTVPKSMTVLGTSRGRQSSPDAPEFVPKRISPPGLGVYGHNIPTQYVTPYIQPHGPAQMTFSLSSATTGPGQLLRWPGIHRPISPMSSTIHLQSHSTGSSHKKLSKAIPIVAPPRASGSLVGDTSPVSAASSQVSPSKVMLEVSTDTKGTWTPPDPLKSTSSPSSMPFNNPEVMAEHIRQTASLQSSQRKPSESTEQLGLSGSDPPQSGSRRSSSSSGSSAEALTDERRPTELVGLPQRQQEAQARSFPDHKARNHEIQSISLQRKSEDNPAGTASASVKLAEERLRSLQDQAPVSESAQPTDIQLDDTLLHATSKTDPFDAAVLTEVASTAPTTAAAESSETAEAVAKEPGNISSDPGILACLTQETAVVGGRGRKLFSVQVQVADKLHDVPLHEHDDPHLLAREVFVQFRDVVEFPDTWRQGIVDFWNLKTERLRKKDAAREARRVAAATAVLPAAAQARENETHDKHESSLSSSPTQLERPSTRSSTATIRTERVRSDRRVA